MPSRESLVIYARSVAHSYATMSMDDRAAFLQDMYEKTVVGKKYDWTHNVGYGTDLDALRQGKWLRKDGRPGGTTVASEGTSWCGIFATYCLRAVGVPAQWGLLTGLDAPKNMLERRSGYYTPDDIGPGDICVVKENQHHFIVHGRAGKKLHSYDGNLAGQMIAEGDNPDTDTLRAGVKRQSDYDKSVVGRVLPQSSKYSFFYYRML